MATSVIAAAMDLYDSLTAANFPSASRPDIYLEPVPVTNAAGTQLYPPYVALRDEGLDVQPTIERLVMEVTELTLTVYYDTLANVDAAVEAIKYNGGATDAGSGFDFGSLSTLTGGGRVGQEIRRLSERRYTAPGLGKTGQRTHACELKYRVSIRRSP